MVKKHNKLKKLDIPVLKTIYPLTIINDVENFLQHLLLEKGSSNNTIIAYRHRILSFLSFLPNHLNKEGNKEIKDITSKVTDLKSLLGGRKQGAKGLDSYSRLAKSSEKNIQSSTSSDNQLEHYPPLPNFSWQNDVSIEVIEEFLSTAYHQEESARTRNLALSSLRSFYDYLIRMNKVTVNYPKMINNLKVENKNPKTLDSKAVNKLLEVVTISNYRELRDQTMFEFMVSTGLRVSELANLNIQDFNLDGRDFLVVGKGNVYRSLPLSHNMLKLLSLYLVFRDRELYEKLNAQQRKELAITEECFKVNLESEEEVFYYACKIVNNAKKYLNQSTKKVQSGKRSTSSNQVKSELKASSVENNITEQVISLSSLLAKKESLSKKENQLAVVPPKSLTTNNTNILDKKLESLESIVSTEYIVGKDFRAETLDLKNLSANSYSLQQAEQSKTDLKQEGSPYHALFLSSHLNRITVRSIQKRLDVRAQAVGLGRKISPHKLRHTFATLFLENSSNLRAVQELLGHKNLATTQIYTNLDLSHLIKVYNKVHPQQKEYFAQQDKNKG